MSKKTKILISGFEPFGGLTLNPTQELMSDLSLWFKASKSNLDFDLETIVLPVEYQRAFELLKEKINEYKPDLVLASGVAQERNYVELERLAINYQSQKHSDNANYTPEHKQISSNGPDAIFSNLDVDDICERLAKENYPIRVSNSAGTYVCNSLMYNLLQEARDNKYNAGFIHVPLIISDSVLSVKADSLSNPLTNKDYNQPILLNIFIQIILSLI